MLPVIFFLHDGHIENFTAAFEEYKFTSINFSRYLGVKIVVMREIFLWRLQTEINNIGIV